MDREKLLVAGVLIGLIICFSVFMVISYGLNLISEIDGEKHFDSSSFSTTSFDNSSPEATAVSIARLNEGWIGFEYAKVINTSLTSDGKYWIVKMHHELDDWVVTVDVKTLMSKKNGGMGPINTWRSLDELKANYIAEIAFLGNNSMDYGRPYKVTLEGKTIWKVPVYNLLANSQGVYGKELSGYVYVDLETGKSKVVNFKTSTTEGWKTLKEVESGLVFRDALRELYPE